MNWLPETPVKMQVVTPFLLRAEWRRAIKPHIMLLAADAGRSGPAAFGCGSRKVDVEVDQDMLIKALLLPSNPRPARDSSSGALGVPTARIGFAEKLVESPGHEKVLQ